MAFLNQKSFSVVTTIGLGLIQVILLIFWVNIDQEFLNSEINFNKTQRIVGSVILIVYYVLLFACHVKERNLYFQIGSLVTLVMGQIVTMTATKQSMWPLLIQSKQVLEIISIIISVISLTNIQLLISIFQNKVAITFPIISFRQQYLLLLFGAFIIQLVITIYFVTCSNFYFYLSELFRSRIEIKNYDVISSASENGSITITVSYFAFIISNYFESNILSWITKFALLAGNATQFYGCSQFEGQQKVTISQSYIFYRDFVDIQSLQYPGCFGLTQNVLVELALISFLFCIIVLLESTVDVQEQYLKPEIKQTNQQQQNNQEQYQVVQIEQEQQVQQMQPEIK